MVGNSLHEHAVQAEMHLEQLATGLAQSGVDEGTIKTVSKMADTARQLVSALGKGQEQTGDVQPPEPQPSQPYTMDSAADSLHNDMRASAARSY